MDPVSAGLVGVSAVTGLLGSLFGGGDAPPDPNAKELPPELEFDMLNKHEEFLRNASETYGKIDTLAKEYDQRLSIIDAGLNNLLPKAELQKALAESATRLATQLGVGAEELAKNGFLTSQDIADMNELKALEGKSSEELVKTDDALQRERASLEQKLRQNPGLSRSARESILRDFDMRAGETVRQGRFERGSALINQRGALRESGFNQATSSLGAMQSELGRYQGIYGQQSAIAGERFATGVAAETTKIGVGQAIQDQFDKLGKYKFSDKTKLSISAGQVGPGSLNYQKGLTPLKSGSTAIGGSASGDFDMRVLDRRLKSGTATRSEIDLLLNAPDEQLRWGWAERKKELQNLINTGGKGRASSVGYDLYNAYTGMGGRSNG